MNVEDLYKHYQGCTLTRGQDLVVRALCDFFNSQDQVFMLCGYAGSGKTFLLKGLNDYLVREAHIPTALLAPTGKAARVLEQKTEGKGATVYSAIYAYPPEYRKFKLEKTKRSFEYRLVFDLADKNLLPFDLVYIIDEASLVSDLLSDSDALVFGSGKLLTDLLDYLELENYKARKLIFVGDNAQLPPVGMDKSPALSVEYFAEHFPKLRVRTVLLDEVVRQRAGSTILSNATALRKQLASRVLTGMSFVYDGTECKELSEHELVDSYCSYTKDIGFSKAAVICATNEMCFNYNALIRSRLFPGKKYAQVHDYLIVMTNNHLYRLNNGDFVKILEIFSEHEKFEVRVPLRQKAEGQKDYQDVQLFFMTAKVFMRANRKNYVVTAVILENQLYSSHREISDTEYRALFIMAGRQFNEENPKKERRDFQDEMSYQEYLKQRRKLRALFFTSNRYLNALRVKFGYAITCHKAQGSEWDRVYVNCDHAQKRTMSETYFRWMYTAITRAQRELLLINPAASLGQTIKFSGAIPGLNKKRPAMQPAALSPVRPVLNYDDLLPDLEEALRAREEDEEGLMPKQGGPFDKTPSPVQTGDLGPRQGFSPSHSGTPVPPANPGPAQPAPRFDEPGIPEPPPGFYDDDSWYESLVQSAEAPMMQTGEGTRPWFEGENRDQTPPSAPGPMSVAVQEPQGHVKPEMPKPDAGSQRGAIPQAPAEPLQPQAEGDEDPLTRKIKEVLEGHGLNLTAVSCEDLNYKKRYALTVNGEALTADINYNGKYEAGDVRVRPMTRIALDVQGVLGPALQGFNLAEGDQAAPLPPLPEREMQIFSLVKRAFDERQVPILGVEAMQYALRFKVKIAGEPVEFDVYYNEKGRIKTVSFVRRKNRAISESAINQVMAIFGELKA